MGPGLRGGGLSAAAACGRHAQPLPDAWPLLALTKLVVDQGGDRVLRGLFVFAVDLNSTTAPRPAHFSIITPMMLLAFTRRPLRLKVDLGLEAASELGQLGRCAGMQASLLLIVRVDLIMRGRSRNNAGITALQGAVGQGIQRLAGIAEATPQHGTFTPDSTRTWSPAKRCAALLGWRRKHRSAPATPAFQPCACARSGFDVVS